MKTLLLMSGGIDSSALAAWIRPDFCLTVDYGQLSALAEIDASTKICNRFGLSNAVLRCNLSEIGVGCMAGQAVIEGAPSPEWWPFRNQLLITIASMRAASLGVGKILIGTVLSDSVHLDGTALFYERMSALLDVQELGIQIAAPALELTSPQLVLRSGIPFEILPLTYSCHKGTVACGECRGCQKRYAIFREIGVEYGLN